MKKVICIIAAVAVLCVALVVIIRPPMSLSRLIYSPIAARNAAEAEQEELKRQVEEKERENAERAYEIENSGDDDVVAGIAGNIFGLVRSGEQVYYDIEE